MKLSKLAVIAIMVCILLVAWDYSDSDVLGLEAAALNMSSSSDMDGMTADAQDVAEDVTSAASVPASTAQDDQKKPTSQTVASRIVNNASPAPDTVWKGMGKNLTLNHYTQSAQVQREIRRIIHDQPRYYHILSASAPYIYYIYQQTQKKGLPAELALIPVIESEFNPHDHSNKGALGLWQLMPETARELGVKDHTGYDGRLNVIASTNAALSYFKDLGYYFHNNWNLAIAAYNCGQGKVESMERRTGSHDFFGMPLPRDTRYYVPRLLAIAEIVKNPKKYGVRLPPISNQPYFDEIKTKKPVSLTTVAKTSGINVDTLHKLNPDYKNGVKPKKGTYTLLVPASKTTAVKKQIADKVVTA